MAITGTVWKQFENDNGTSHYVLQLEGIEGRSLEAVKMACCSGWRYSGEGADRSDRFMLLYSRDFRTLKDLSAWTKTFQYPVSLLKPERASKLRDDDDAEQPKMNMVKLPGKKEKKAKPVGKPSDGQRRCGKCGAVGHNARTCNADKAAAVKLDRGFLLRRKPKSDAPAKQKICSVCGNLGHNKRTCKQHKET